MYSLQEEDQSSYDLSSHASDDDLSDSSLSENFIKKWPDTYFKTVQFVKDTEIDIKRYRLERSNNEMEAELIDREIELQNEIGEITTELTNLRLQLTQLEVEMGNIKDQRSSDLINIRTSLASQLRKYQPILSDSEHTIYQLQEAIEAQRDNHERNKEIYEISKSDEEKALDFEIERLQTEIENVRKSTMSLVESRDADSTDAETTIELLNAEIMNVKSDSDNLQIQKQQIQRNLAEMKAELIIAEETSTALQSQIKKNSQLRAKMKGVIDRVRLTNWKAKNENFQFV
ncbi:hypothetical protein TRFO_07022 [Tritrichomonas foetus]|uniref:Uncharacterized protein n=1 Tax=Tritrichomonas foetus TaxID=1144522 RepID=A0A1J4JU01_9EUKA|nr:hypothetical protein TRFO_07022 [Tritrichomonas foetus]|eukprot:OHT02609.1 hypothetical protein TRFO_07022 [Tritrichomonas foetus]